MKSTSSVINLKEQVLRQLCSAETRYQTLQSYAEQSIKRRDALENQLKVLRDRNNNSDIDQLLQQLQDIVETADENCKALSKLSETESVYEWILGQHEAWKKPLSSTKLKLSMQDAQKKLAKRHKKGRKLLHEVLGSEKQELEIHKYLIAARPKYYRSVSEDHDKRDQLQKGQGGDPVYVHVRTSPSNTTSSSKCQPQQGNLGSIAEMLPEESDSSSSEDEDLVETSPTARSSPDPGMEVPLGSIEEMLSEECDPSTSEEEDSVETGPPARSLADTGAQVSGTEKTPTPSSIGKGEVGQLKRRIRWGMIAMAACIVLQKVIRMKSRR